MATLKTSLTHVGKKATPVLKKTTPEAHPAEQKLPSLETPSQANLTAQDMVYLQRTIGNKAAAGLLNSQSVSRSAAPVIQRGMMKYEEFLKQTGQTKDNTERFSDSQNRNVKALNQARARHNPTHNPLMSHYLMSEGPDHRNLVDINAAYKKATETENVETLAKLYDSITYWQVMYANMPETKDYAPVLNGVLGNVRERVNDLSESENKARSKVSDGSVKPSKKSGTEKAAKFLKNKIVPGRGKNDAGLEALVQHVEMPAVLKEMGIAYAWFEANCIDESDPGNRKADAKKLGYLQNLKIALEKQRGQPDEENIIRIQFNIGWLESQIGVSSMYMLKQNLFATYQVVIPELLGSARDVGGDDDAKKLTPQEIQAIIKYSTQNYKEINGLARGAAPQQTETKADRKKWRTNALSPEELKKSQESEGLQAQMQQIVSGLNKLPRFSGITYRGLMHPPAGFESYAKPGAGVSDLGFSSTSPSMAVVYKFLATAEGEGSRNVFYILHTKTGANIVELSFNVQEGEILFRPGTRFTVNNVWTHDAKGNVPSNAPAEAKMILHRKAPEMNKMGKSYAEWTKSRDTEKDVSKLFDADGKPLSYEGGFRTKVIEATEI